MLEELDERYNLSDTLKSIFDLLRLVLFILFIAHLCGCFWHYLAVYEIN